MAGKLKSHEEAVAQAVQHGLLTLGDGWQDKRLANKAQSSMAYFLANASPRQAPKQPGAVRLHQTVDQLRNGRWLREVY